MLLHRRANPSISFAGTHYTPRWREAVWESRVLPKNSTQCPRPGLEPTPLVTKTSALTARPPRIRLNTRKQSVKTMILSLIATRKTLACKMHETPVKYATAEYLPSSNSHLTIMVINCYHSKYQINENSMDFVLPMGQPPVWEHDYCLNNQIKEVKSCQVYTHILVISTTFVAWYMKICLD